MDRLKLVPGIVDEGPSIQYFNGLQRPTMTARAGIGSSASQRTVIKSTFKS